MDANGNGQGITDGRGMTDEDKAFWHIQFDQWQRVLIWLVIPFAILQTDYYNFVWIWVIWSVLAVLTSDYSNYSTIERKYR